MKITIIVSGVPCVIDVEHAELVDQVVATARKVTANTGANGVPWELRRPSGVVLEANVSLAEHGVGENAVLFLSPIAGAGSEDIPSGPEPDYVILARAVYAIAHSLEGKKGCAPCAARVRIQRELRMAFRAATLQRLQEATSC